MIFETHAQICENSGHHPGAAGTVSPGRKVERKIISFRFLHVWTVRIQKQFLLPKFYSEFQIKISRVQNYRRNIWFLFEKNLTKNYRCFNIFFSIFGGFLKKGGIPGTRLR
jgi:hypothetical protein